MSIEQPPLRTPTHIWLDAKIRELSAQGVGVYVTHKGEKMSGLVLLKIIATPQDCKLQTQQRNFETNALEWVNVFENDIIKEDKADEYITRSIKRDPDQWVVEIEDKALNNPFYD